MGGNTGGSAKPRSEKAADEKDVNEWLQIVIDSLAFEYGWTKDAIFSMFPAEIEILMRRIRENHERREDAELLRLMMAARAPHTEDAGQAIINTIMAKYKEAVEEEVTEESIKREMAIARSLMQR